MRQRIDTLGCTPSSAIAGVYELLLKFCGTSVNTILFADAMLRMLEPGSTVVQNLITFVDTPLPKCIDGIAPPHPAPQRCAVTSAPAKYLDPHTGCA